MSSDKEADMRLEDHAAAEVARILAHHVGYLQDCKQLYSMLIALCSSLLRPERRSRPRFLSTTTTTLQTWLKPKLRRFLSP
jgi:predicted transcriptional regulator